MFHITIYIRSLQSSPELVSWYLLSAVWARSPAPERGQQAVSRRLHSSSRGSYQQVTEGLLSPHDGLQGGQEDQRLQRQDGHFLLEERHTD